MPCTIRTVPTEAPPSVREASPPSGPTEGPAADIRRERPYLLRPAPWSGLLRRAVSVTALAVLDVSGLALGIYAALVLRSLVYGDEIYWSLLWDTGPKQWLPFLAPITALVFPRSVAMPMRIASGTGIGPSTISAIRA